MNIEYIPIDTITPYANNAKEHPEEQIAQIKASIEEFGMNDPVAIWGMGNLIVEGHGRYYACLELGMKKIPVIRLDELTDEQRRAYTLVHNKLAMETGFDLETLERELDEIGTDMSRYGLSRSLEEMDIGDLQEFFDEAEEAIGDTPRAKTCTCPNCGRKFERK